MTPSTLKLEIMTALSASALILSHTSVSAAAADDATVSSNLRKNKNMRQEKSLLPGPFPNQPAWLGQRINFTFIGMILDQINRWIWYIQIIIHSIVVHFYSTK